MIYFLSRATYIHVDFCFSELARANTCNLECWPSTKRTASSLSSRHQNVICSHHNIQCSLKIVDQWMEPLKCKIFYLINYIPFYVHYLLDMFSALHNKTKLSSLKPKGLALYPVIISVPFSKLFC